jgi:putative tricarboxylic transport membrane protein
MKKGNFVTAAIGCLFGILVLIEAFRLPRGTNGVPGPALFPTIVSAIMILCSVALFLRTLKMDPKDAVAIQAFSNDSKRVYLVMAILIVYLMVMPYIGFCTTTVVLMFALIKWFSAKKALPCFLISAAVTAAVYLIFNKVLNVPLNFGLLI